MQHVRRAQQIILIWPSTSFATKITYICSCQRCQLLAAEVSFIAFQPRQDMWTWQNLVIPSQFKEKKATIFCELDLRSCLSGSKVLILFW